MKLNKNHQAGVLLLEVLISILIFSFGILGLVGLQAISIQNSTNAEERIVAANLANDLVAHMWLRKSSLTSDTNLKADIELWQDRVAKSLLTKAEGTVALKNELTTITIIWRSPSKKKDDNINKYETTLVIP